MSQPSPASEATLQITRVFKAERARVFQAFVDSEAMREWFCPTGFSFDTITVDPTTGRGRVFVMRHDESGHRYVFSLDYRVVDVPERIEWISTWRDGFPEPGKQTVATIDFRDVPGGTEVTLTQRGFSTNESRNEHTKGWNGGLDKLAVYLATPTFGSTVRDFASRTPC